MSNSIWIGREGEGTSLGIHLRCRADGTSAGGSGRLASPGQRHGVVPLPGHGFLSQTVSIAGDSSDEGAGFRQ